jgi:hypothetical protein
VLFCVFFFFFFVVLCTVCEWMCVVLLPPGAYPIAVKYIISISIIMRHSVQGSVNVDIQLNSARCLREMIEKVKNCKMDTTGCVKYTWPVLQY